MQPLHVRSQPLGVQHQTSEACWYCWKVGYCA
jgi:hypothetical protein